jgi:hypothetical protein
VAEDGGREPVWNQTFLFNLEAKNEEQDMIHIEVENNNVTTDDHIGRADVKIGQLVQNLGTKKFIQLVDLDNFTKMVGQVEVTVDFKGTGLAASAAASPAAATAAASPTPAVAPVSPQPILFQQAPVQPVQQVQQPVRQVQQPVQQYQQPVQQYQQPVQQYQQPQPVVQQQPIYSAPVQQPQYASYQQPIQQQPMYQPVQQAPIYQQPIQPIYASPQPTFVPAQPVYQQPIMQPTYYASPQPIMQPVVYQQPVMVAQNSHQHYHDGMELMDQRHAHPLRHLSSVYAGVYTCNGCGQEGRGKVFHCGVCDFDLHPQCIQKRY